MREHIGIIVSLPDIIVSSNDVIGSLPIRDGCMLLALYMRCPPSLRSSIVNTAANMDVEEDTSYYPHYPSKRTFVLAGIHYVLGILISLLCVPTIVIGGTRVMSGMAVHLGFGIYMIITGVVGSAAGKRKTANPIVGFLFMSGMACMFAVYAFFAFVAVAIKVAKVRPGEPGRFVLAEVLGFISLYMLTAVVSGLASVFTFRAIFCGHQRSPETVDL